MTGPPLTEEELSRVRETFARIPYTRLLGIEFVSAARGTATFRLAPREELSRMEGIMHGGAIASLLDTAAAFAVHTLLGPSGRTVTVDLTIHYLRPVTGGEIQARARVLREGRRLVILSIEATEPDGTLAATATTTYVKQG